MTRDTFFAQYGTNWTYLNETLGVYDYESLDTYLLQVNALID